MSQRQPKTPIHHEVGIPEYTNDDFHDNVQKEQLFPEVSWHRTNRPV